MIEISNKEYKEFGLISVFSILIENLEKNSIIKIKKKKAGNK